MLKGFKAFVLRGNVVDLAVAVVIGGAFGAVVAALVKDLLTPLIAAIVGKPDFSAIAFTVNGSKFLIGDFINAVVAFVLVAAAIYFFVVLPMNMVMERRRRGEAPRTRRRRNARSASARCPSRHAAVRFVRSRSKWLEWDARRDSDVSSHLERSPNLCSDPGRRVACVRGARPAVTC